ncbi:MAG: ABC transporter permease [Ktedonobacterales bacterium]
MRIDESAEKTGSQPFDDGFSINPASELRPTGLLIPESILQENADVTLSQSELDLQAQRDLAEGQSLSPMEASLRRLGRDRRAMICLGIVLIMVVGSYIFPVFYLHMGPTVLAGITGTVKTPPEVYHYMTHQELLLADAPSSWMYPLGTDALGRDNLSRLMAGVNVSIQVALFVEVFDIGLGLLVGVQAGFFGGVTDTFLARFTDLMFAFPALLFAILAAATLGPAFVNALGPEGRLILVSIALGITIWPQMARFVRGQTLQLKEQQFIEAARMSGSSNQRIMIQHIAPNLFSIVVAAATLDVVGTIIAEATLSLLSLGVEPPGSSLGLMIFDGTQRLYINAWEVVWPVLTLSILVLALAFLGDGVNDAFNPRTKD